VRGNEEAVRDGEVRRGKPERPAALVSGHDCPFELGRAAQELGCLADLPLAKQLADAAGRDTWEQRDRLDVESEDSQGVRVTPPTGPETKAVTRDYDPGSKRLQDMHDELIRQKARELGCELDDQGLVRPGVGKKFEPPLEGRQELDLVAEHGSRVRFEGDDSGAKAGGDGGPDHSAMSAVDAVERADGDGPLGGLGLLR